MKQSEIVVTDSSFCLFAPGASYTLPFRDLLKIQAYKIDEITTDLICWDVLLCVDGGKMTFTLHEELPGFEELDRHCRKLPGFDAEWMAKVMKPAFSESRTLIYARPDEPA